MSFTIADIIEQTFLCFARNWVTLVLGNLIAGVISFAPFVLCSTLTLVPLYLAAQHGGDPTANFTTTTFGPLIASLVGSMVLWILFAPALARIAVAAAREEDPQHHRAHQR